MVADYFFSVSFFLPGVFIVSLNECFSCNLYEMNDDLFDVSIVVGEHVEFGLLFGYLICDEFSFFEIPIVPVVMILNGVEGLICIPVQYRHGKNVPFCIFAHAGEVFAWNCKSVHAYTFNGTRGRIFVHLYYVIVSKSYLCRAEFTFFKFTLIPVLFFTEIEPRIYYI